MTTSWYFAFADMLRTAAVVRAAASRVVFGLAVTLSLFWAPRGSAVGAVEPPTFTAAAAKLRAATVTVRVALPVKAPAPPAVTVSSGIAVAPRLVVSSVYATSDARIRVTAPTGAVADARLRVIDEYTGLSLLELDGLAPTPLELDAPPLEAGAWVVSAAAWGAEAPVVSFGVVSGVERQLPGYPPLLQCDVRTAETSAGAAIVDSEGRMAAVVVATGPRDEGGWTYGVPASHVRRLLRAWETRPGRDLAARRAPATNAGVTIDSGVVVLKRRRPEVGMELADDGQQRIMVQRVFPNSPAQQAGVVVGDEVIAADGVQIRSVYQALRPVLARQPGDVLKFRLQSADGQTRDVEVVLGGGVELPSAPLERLGELVLPKLRIEGVERGFLARRPGRDSFVGQPPASEFEAPDAAGEQGAAPPPIDERLRILEKAVDRYRQVIELQQEQLERAERRQREDQALLEQLRRELEEVRK